MKPRTLCLATAALLVGVALAPAQEQFDSLGSPTPAANQEASPNTVAPNNPQPAGTLNAGSPKSTAPNKSETTGSGADMPTGASSGTKPGSRQNTPATDSGVTPNGLTPE